MHKVKIPRDIMTIDEKNTVLFTPEHYNIITKANDDAKEYLKETLGDSQKDHLKIIGWEGRVGIQSDFYDKLLTNDLKIKTLTLEGRGEWTTCCCPKTTRQNGGLIDTITEKRKTHLEHIYIFRTFKINSCALLDLVSRSPNLKCLKFYGVILEDSHYEQFLSVRFLSDLNSVFWPWCNPKTHKPTLRTLIKRNENIETLYTQSDIACDFINSDLLPNLKYLSLIMNERWICAPNKTKILKRYNRNINALRRADKVEALEVRTFDILYQLLADEEGDNETHDLIKNNYEQYKLNFWENVKDLQRLKYLGFYGAWDLEEVTREMAKHGLQIEYFRTNLMPNSILGELEQGYDNTTKSLFLVMSDAAKHLAKLAKLKSLFYNCHDNISNIDDQTAASLGTLSDLIWRFDIKCPFTAEVEEFMKNMLRRGMQNGRSYRIGLLIKPENCEYGNVYVEAVEKHTSESNLRDNLTERARSETAQRFGKSALGTFEVWGIGQDKSSRDIESFKQLRNTWNFYENLFEPVDQFV